jgi:hypothetical protein
MGQAESHNRQTKQNTKKKEAKPEPRRAKLIEKQTEDGRGSSESGPASTFMVITWNVAEEASQQRICVLRFPNPVIT